MLETSVAAVIGIGHFAHAKMRRVIEEETDFMAMFGRAEALQIAQVPFIHSQDIIVLRAIPASNLSRALAADIDAAATRGLLRAAVGPLACMIAGRARGVHLNSMAQIMFGQ